jgi:uncharacterized membrane protein YfcA
MTGGAVGMFAGRLLAARLAGPALQRIFAMAIVAVAFAMAIRAAAATFL